MPNNEPEEPIPATLADSHDRQAAHQTTGRETYNIVSDTTVGVNIRWSDNAFQAVVILAAVVLLALVGTVLAILNADWQLPWYGGAGIGAAAGLVLGFFGSGFYLMIYRAVRHLQGKHD